MEPEHLLPSSAKEELAEISRLWDAIVAKVTGYAKEMQEIAAMPGPARNLLAMDEGLNKMTAGTRRYQKALDEIARGQAQARNTEAQAEEQHQAQLHSTKTKHAQKNLDSAIAYLRRELEAARLHADERKVLEAQLQEIRLKNEALTNKKIKRSREELNKQLAALSKEMFSAAAAIHKTMSKSQVAAIDAQLKAGEEQKKTDIALANAAVATEEEKQERIKAIEEAYANERSKLQDEKKEEQRKAAEFEKRLAIAKSAFEGAAAVVAALPDIPKSIAVGVIAAAKLAAIAATPIPGFFRGTDDAPRGLAFVGERGTEAIVGKDGSVVLTPAKSTLAWLEGGEQIIPHHLLDAFLAPRLEPPGSKAPTAPVLPAFDKHTRILQQTLQGQNQILRQIRDRQRQPAGGAEWKPYIHQQVFK